MRARLLCAIGLSLWSATTLARQAAPPIALPRELRAHLQNERFDIVSSMGGLPRGLRTELRTLFGGQGLDIADPGEPFDVAGPTTGSKLPTRRLVAAGCSRDDCLLYYERAGRPRTWRVLLFHWTPNTTTLEWGGTAPSGLTTIAQIRGAVLSGAIKGSAGPW